MDFKLKKEQDYYGIKIDMISGKSYVSQVNSETHQLKVGKYLYACNAYELFRLLTNQWKSANSFARSRYMYDDHVFFSVFHWGMITGYGVQALRKIK